MHNNYEKFVICMHYFFYLLIVICDPEKCKHALVSRWVKSTVIYMYACAVTIIPIGCYNYCCYVAT